MEDDDEFGDLYTDVLSSFPPSAPPPPQSPPPFVSAVASAANNNSRSAAALATSEDVGIPGLNVDTTTATATATAVAAPASEATPGLGPSLAQQGGGGGGGGWGSESDSESEDDLQIVLNDNINNPMDPNSMIIRDDDDDGDDDDLIIVADHSQQLPQLPGSEEPECADETGEAKDSNNPGLSTGVAPAPPHKFGNYGFPSFHSQFKYVRPGAQLLPAGPGGAPGQVRPPINMTNMAGRGRGDWRPSGMKGPSMQKGFHPGFWGNNAPGRGLEFTLPSHKNIFDVDIDSFEEKPWKYPGVDVSDFFNFNLNEESWKEYCKQLEQLRLASTMQSKIRVYESGRAEQEYDPDLPPELAAAAGIHDSSTGNVDIAKADGLGDSAKGSTRTRPPLPTGRAIQVETGYGERLPSVDTRPPRMRDSDAVIEIVLQDSLDDGSAENNAIEHSDNEVDREDDQVDVVNEHDPQEDVEVFDRYPKESDATKADLARERSPLADSPNTHVQDEECDGSSPQRASSDDHPGSGDHAPSENTGSPYEERWMKTTGCERSSHMSSGETSLDRKSLDYQREDSIESVERKHFQESSQVCEEDAQASLDGKAATDDDLPSEVKSVKGKDIDVVGSADKTKNKHKLHSSRQRNMDSRVEPSASKDDDGGEVRASMSAENNKAAGRSRDNQKWREVIDEEVVPNGHSNSTGEIKMRHGEVRYDSRRKDYDGRMEMDRNQFSAEGREEYYSHKDWDPYAANKFHVKPEAGDRRRDRDYTDVSWQRRDEDHLGRRIRAEDGRKQERADDMVSRHRSKGREINRGERDEYLASRNTLDNGNWRGYHDKDPGPRYREKDDGSKNRHEILDDHHGKRRKEEEHRRRDHADKEDILLGHRESSSARGKRERDGFLDHRKRDDPPRVRDKSDDHHPLRLKDEVWMQRERVDQQRARDEWYRAKSSYEDNMSRKEREDGRAPSRSSRGIDENLWVGHSRGREEYKGPEKDAGRHSERQKKRERVEEAVGLQHRGSEDVYARGSQFVSEGKRPRQERSAVRNEHTPNASDSQKFHWKKHKDNFKKARELEGHSPSAPLKRHQVEKGISNDVAEVKILSVAQHDISSRKLTREGREDVSSDDEQHYSKRGRSKLERWTSHKDGEYDVNSKSSAPMKIKGAGKDRIAGSGPSIGVRDESAKNVEADVADQTSSAFKESGSSEGKDLDPKAADDRHIDTVEKLKRRSERFKLPLASEKETQTIKKTENETLPSSQSETPANPEVKQERPPRKRRWINS